MNLPENIDPMLRKTSVRTMLGIVLAMGIWACVQNKGATSNEKWRCNNSNPYGCASGNNDADHSSSSNVSAWARSVSGPDDISMFFGAALDSSGNIFAVGYQYSTTSYGYGNGVSAAGASNQQNAVIVKYSATGQALWSRTPTSNGPGKESIFYRVKTDASGNVYAIGNQDGGTYTYGPGVTAAGLNIGVHNGVVVKYDANGNAQWARATNIPVVLNGTPVAEFSDIALDASGNVFVCGIAHRGGTYDYGSGVTLTPPNTNNYDDAILVKYDTNGVPQWARTVTSGETSTSFAGVTLDSSGNIYAVGKHQGNTTVNYGSGISVTPPQNVTNPVIVKYDSAGTPQWAKSVTAGPGDAVFRSVAIDTAGDLYAVGEQRGPGTYTYATGVNATGAFATANAPHPLIVKYNSVGQAQWAKTPTASQANATFYTVATDSNGDIYVGGGQYTYGTFTYASGTDATGAAQYGENAVIVRYNASGLATWAKSTLVASVGSTFLGIALSGSKIITVGYQNGNTSYSYASGVSTTGASANNQNAVVIRYQ